jgi:hypothetical protein
MTNKVLSVRQPYATLICAGVKTVENRTWKTDYRGKLLIHASGDNFAYPDSIFLPEKYRTELFERMEAKDQEKAWKDAPESMLHYCWLLAEAWKFYGKDIDKDQYHPDKWLNKDVIKEHGFFMPAQAIIGECILSDIIQDSKDDFAELDCYHWILTEPYLYDKPKTNVLGHLRLWNFET